MEKKGFFESSIALFKSRKEAVFAYSWAAILGTIIGGKGIPPLTKSFLSVIAFVMINLSVYIYNDLIDREMDAYSKAEKKKGRPIAQGIVSENNAMRFVLVSGLLGLGIYFMISQIVFLMGLTYYIIFFLYSYPGVRFKKMYVIKNIITCLGMPTAFLMSGIIVENTLSLNISFYALTYFGLSLLLLPAVADSLDIEEDLAFNVKTIGNQLSWKQNVILFNIGILFIAGGTVIAYLLFNIHYIAPILMIGLCIPSMAYSLRLINEDISTASIKLRPFGYSVAMFIPLIWALGVVF